MIRPSPSSTKGASGDHGKSNSPKKRTVTSLSDYFGSAPVKRSEVAVKRSHKVCHVIAIVIVIQSVVRTMEGVIGAQPLKLMSYLIHLHTQDHMM